MDYKAKKKSTICYLPSIIYRNHLSSGICRILPAIFYLLSIICFLVSCLLPLDPCFAQSGDAGQAGEFLRYGVGARALGMGRAFTAVSNDASAIYWNPAGLAQLNRWEVTTMYNTLFLDSRYLYLGGVYPYKDKGTFGLGFINLHTGDFEGRDEFNQYTRMFNNNEIGLYASYGRKLFWRLYGGTSLKLLQQKLDDVSHSGTGIDFGLTVKPFLDKKLNLALTVQNLGGNIGDDDIPLSTKFGAKYTYSDFMFAGDGQLMSDRNLEPAIGVEYNYHRKLFGRFGLNRTEYAFGFGLPIPVKSLQSWQVDFAYAHHKDDLGGSIRVSFTYTGAGAPPPPCGPKGPCPYEEDECEENIKAGYWRTIEEKKYSNVVETAIAYTCLGYCAFHEGLGGDEGKFREAEDYFKEAENYASGSDVFKYWTNLYYMECLMYQQKWTEALDIYENRMVEKGWEAIYDAGYCYLQNGDISTARSTFERLIEPTMRIAEDEGDPGYKRTGLAYLRLAEIHKETGRSTDIDQAIEYLNSVTATYSNYLDCYSHLFPIYPDNMIGDDAQFLLGECYLIKGDENRALIEYGKVIMFYPNSDIIGKALEKINELTQ